MEKLGINPVYLITQIVNFTVLVVVLSILVYKPILEMLEKRKKKIEESLALTEKMQKEEEQMNLKTEKVIKEAQKEAREILENAREQGKKLEANLLKEARDAATEIVERGKKDNEIRKKELEATLYQEAINMASVLTEKLIGEALDEKKQKEVLKKRIAHFLQQKKIS